MICSTCCNALIRKLESGLDRGQRITCGIDGWGSLQTVVECSHYLAVVVDIKPKGESYEDAGLGDQNGDVVTVRRTQSERMKEYWKKKREAK